MGGSGAKRHALRGVLREGGAARIFKVWSARVGEARGTGEDAVLRIINVKVEPRINQGTFFSSRPEGVVIVHATVDSDRLEAHGETRNM